MTQLQKWEPVSATYARDNFAELMNQVMYQNRQFIVKKQGKIAAYIMPSIQDISTKISSKINGHQFLSNLSHYGLKKAPKDLAKNHDKYAWE
jgi:hypothetical protein